VVGRGLQTGPMPRTGWIGHSGKIIASSRTEGGAAYTAIEKSEMTAQILKIVARMMLLYNLKKECGQSSVWGSKK
jgi:hypothetical protein